MCINTLTYSTHPRCGPKIRNQQILSVIFKICTHEVRSYQCLQHNLGAQSDSQIQDTHSLAHHKNYAGATICYVDSTTKMYICLHVCVYVCMCVCVCVCACVRAHMWLYLQNRVFKIKKI